MGWKDKDHTFARREGNHLCMPVMCKRTVEAEDGAEDAEVFTRFVYRPNWCVLSKTDGQPVELTAIREWDQTRALG